MKTKYSYSLSLSLLSLLSLSLSLSLSLILNSGTFFCSHLLSFSSRKRDDWSTCMCESVFCRSIFCSVESLAEQWKYCLGTSLEYKRISVWDCGMIFRAKSISKRSESIIEKKNKKKTIQCFCQYCYHNNFPQILESSQFLMRRCYQLITLPVLSTRENGYYARKFYVFARHILTRINQYLQSSRKWSKDIWATWQVH